MKKYILASTALLAATVASAQTTNEAPQTATAESQIVVSATRIETPIEQMANTVNVIGNDDIENSKQRTVTDLLESVPGISITRNGGPGQLSAIYLRGAKPQHTLVLIDGVRMNGQLDLNGYNLTHLQATDIERIEILKGPQSPLYGSDAMAGAINIITKKGEGKPTPYYDIEGGSYGTWRATTGINGGDDLMNYSTSVSHFDRQGESATATDTEKDGTENTTVSTRLGFTPGDSTSIDLTLRYIDATSDYDDGIDNHGQLVTRAAASTLLFNEHLDTQLGISYLMLDHENISAFGGVDKSETISADWQNTIFIGEGHTLLAGIDAYQDDYDFSAGKGDLNNIGIFATYHAILFKNWIANLGLRNDEHSEFRNETTYQASMAYRVRPTRTMLKGSWGTGFKAPSSYHLFSTSGNPNLNPETSESWEIGFEQQIISNRFNVGATYFHTDYDQFIDYFDPDGWIGPIPGSYQNISEAKTDGVEVYATATPLDKLIIRCGYTYLDNDDQSTGVGFEIRRPTHKVDLNINYAATEKLNLNLNTSYASSRKDLDFSTWPAAEIVLDPYTLINVSVRYQATEKLQLYGRIDNLLNEDYQTAYGYNQDEISAYVGTKIAF